MYHIGEQVVYGIHGVCRIVGQEERVMDRKRITYLVLEPLGQSGSRFMVPSHNPAAMAKLSRLLSRQELEELLGREELHAGTWNRDENQRKQSYRELISSGNRLALLQTCALLYRHRQEQQAAGRKVHMCDDNFLRDAEKLLCGEISLVLQTDADTAKQYLRQALAE